MGWIALTIALAQQAPPRATAALPNWRRVYTSQGLHVGVAGAAFVDPGPAWGLGVTVQVTAFVP